jgi:hypothetical protein
MKLPLALMLLAMSAPECDPSSIDAANIQPGDGGVWLGGRDGGLWVDQADVPAPPGEKPLLPWPDDSVLCQLVVGNLTGRGTAPEGWQGLWIRDVINILGENNGISQRSADGAQLAYLFRKPGALVDSSGFAPQINLLLQFEKTLAFDNAQRDGSHLVPFTDPYFLTSIDAQGLDEAKACWDPSLRFASSSMFIPCESCAQQGREFGLCKDLGLDVTEDCFREDF